MLTVLIKYNDVLKQGFIVCVSDTHHFTYKSANLQAMHENCGINIRELFNLSEHNLSITGKVFEQCSNFEHIMNAAGMLVSPEGYH